MNPREAATASTPSSPPSAQRAEQYDRRQAAGAGYYVQEAHDGCAGLPVAHELEEHRALDGRAVERRELADEQATVAREISTR